MPEVISFTVTYQNGAPGLNSFELWKLEHSLPLATWADYENYMRGRNGVDGFAVPMTETERLAIAAPVVGQVINQTDGGRGEWTWLGTYWIYKENRPYSTKTINASRNLAVSDLGYILMVDSATDITLTVPQSVFNLGHKLFFIQKGVGKVTIAVHASITLQAPPFYSYTSSGPGSLLELIFTSQTLAYLQGHTL